MACTQCGGNRVNPPEPSVVGPAVVLGNGAHIPFDSDEAAERYVARKAARGDTDLLLIRTGETHA